MTSSGSVAPRRAPAPKVSHPVEKPLMTIGIPTFNRAGPLHRAVKSALSQDYRPLEIVISDNASGDGTQAYCAILARQHDEVRYVRMERNIGALGNFESALRSARGEYFMWLGDDDWIDMNYVSECVEQLEGNPFLQLVAGRAQYYAEETLVLVGEMLEILHQRPWDRVVAYYREVRLNGVIYGVARTEVLLQLLPLKHSFGRDWMMSASLACAGGIRTLTSTSLHRTVGGMSSDPDLIGQVGLGSVAARLPYSGMLVNVCADILFGSMYSTVGKRRLSLACVSGLLCLQRNLRVKAGAYRLKVNRSIGSFSVSRRRSRYVGRSSS